MKFTYLFVIVIIGCFTSIHAQVDSKKHTEHTSGHQHQHDANHKHDTHAHEHQHDSQQCGLCHGSLLEQESGSALLLNEEEASFLEKYNLHYHGLTESETHSAFQCAGCQKHIGFFDHEASTYQVFNSNISEEDAQFYCAACQSPIFKTEELSLKGDSTTSFTKSVNNNSVLLDNKGKYYVVPGVKDVCGRCQSRLGEYNKNGSGGFGVRVNLGPLGGGR